MILDWMALGEKVLLVVLVLALLLAGNGLMDRVDAFLRDCVQEGEEEEKIVRSHGQKKRFVLK